MKFILRTENIPAEDIEKEQKYFSKKIKATDEIIFRVRKDGTFYFLCTESFDLKQYQISTGFHIIDTKPFNDKYIIGYGLHSAYTYFDFLMIEGMSEQQGEMLEDILMFTFDGKHPDTFYPGPVKAREFSCYGDYFDEDEADELPAYYMYSYMPKSRSEKLTLEQRKVARLLYDFKNGKNPALVAKLVSMAVYSIPDIEEGLNKPVFCVIPASDEDRHYERFDTFGKELSRRLRIKNGCADVIPYGNRPQNKGGKGWIDLCIYIDEEVIRGHDVLLFDDVYNSGRSLKEMCRRLKECGAQKITALFLTKTIET